MKDLNIGICFIDPRSHDLYESLSETETAYFQKTIARVAMDFRQKTRDESQCTYPFSLCFSLMGNSPQRCFKMRGFVSKSKDPRHTSDFLVSLFIPVTMDDLLDFYNGNKEQGKILKIH